MKINLRKASALQSNIRTAISERNKKINGVCSLPLWKPDDTKIAGERSRQMGSINDVDRLENILMNIRVAVGNENFKNDVNTLLAEQQLVKSQLQRATTLSGYTPTMSSSDIELRVANLKEQATKSTYGIRSGGDNLDVGVFSTKDIEKFESNVTKFRRRLVQIDESLLSANIKSEIDIPDEDWKWLEIIGIV